MSNMKKTNLLKHCNKYAQVEVRYMMLKMSVLSYTSSKRLLNFLLQSLLFWYKKIDTIGHGRFNTWHK